MLWRGRATLEPGWQRSWWGGLLAGAGGFNLYDGTVQHKLLGLHEVREAAADDVPYDVAFLAGAAIVLAAGAVTLRRRATS